MGPEPKRFEVIVSSSLSPPKNLFVEVRNCEFLCQASGCHYTDILSLSEYGSASAKNRWLKPCVGLGRCLADQSGGRTWPTTRSMTIPQENRSFFYRRGLRRRDRQASMVGARICLLGAYLSRVMTEAVDFVCPRCTSRYKLVRVRSDRELPSRLIHCRVCKEPLAPTDGEYVLKYFLVDKVKKHNGIDLHMNHALKGGRSHR